MRGKWWIDTAEGESYPKICSKGDTFRLQIPSRGYDTGVQTLKSGDVKID